MTKPLKHRCGYCDKEYSRKIYYDRHTICCSLKSMSSIGNKKELEELNDTPSTRELYLIIQELVKRQNDMEKELKKLRRNSFKEKGKIDTIEWLNKLTVTFDFESWRDFLKINKNDLEITFKQGINCGILSILKNHLQDGTKEYPIKAFEHSSNTLYIYKNKTWNIMNQDEFKSLTKKINQMIIQEFKVWMDELKQQDKLKNYSIEEYVFIVFDKNIKIMEIKTNLYEFLKISIQESI